MTTAPRLWLSNSRLQHIRSLLQQNEPTVVGIRDACSAIASQPFDHALSVKLGLRYADACATLHLLSPNPALAQKAAESFLHITEDWSLGNLGKGSYGLSGAVIHQTCHADLPPALQFALTQRVHKCFWASRETEFHPGDPHTVTNNHWAVVHGGAAMAAMAVHGFPLNQNSPPLDLTQEIAWAIGRTKAFASLHGDRGLYHEGLGYLAYPATFWLPALLAWQNFSGESTDSLLQTVPGLPHLAASMFGAATNRPTISDETYQPSGDVGMKLSWNDDGLGWAQSATIPLMIHYALPQHRGALRTMYDRLNGIHGNKKFCPMWAGPFFTLATYPFDTPPENPDKILPKHYTDSRQGISIFRNAYIGPDDAILGAYARVQLPGGHSHDDAGSLRFMALGHDWIMGGGQNHPLAEWQSIVTPVDKVRPKPWGLASIMFDHATPTTGLLAIDLRRSTIGYHERYIAVDFAPQSNSTVHLALLDLIDDHSTRQWHWNMTFSPLLQFSPHEDNRGFSLVAPDGANLTARFFGSTPTHISQQRMPDSKRTFQSDTTPHIYPGRPFVQALFEHEPHVAIYCAISIQRGPAPSITNPHALDLSINNTPWLSPFSPAIPPTYRLNQSGGLCKFSAGTKSFHAQ